jgi:hypothetical protein
MTRGIGAEDDSGTGRLQRHVAPSQNTIEGRASSAIQLSHRFCDDGEMQPWFAD